MTNTSTELVIDCLRNEIVRGNLEFNVRPIPEDPIANKFWMTAAEIVLQLYCGGMPEMTDEDREVIEKAVEVIEKYGVRINQGAHLDLELLGVDFIQVDWHRVVRQLIDDRERRKA